METTRSSTVVSSPCSECSSESEARNRKEKPQVVGYTLQELREKRREPFWKTARVIAIILFWAVWAALLGGSVLIIVLNNGDVPKSTTTISPTTTKYV